MSTVFKPKNLGYEGKIASRIAKLHPSNPSKETLKDLQVRFRLFKEVRDSMSVVDVHPGNGKCYCCGKLHLNSIHVVQVYGSATVTIGADCIDNISYVVGDGLFQVRKDLAYGTAVEKAVSDGTVSKETHRRYKIRVSKGWKKPEVPESFSMGEIRELLNPAR